MRQTLSDYGIGLGQGKTSSFAGAPSNKHADWQRLLLVCPSQQPARQYKASGSGTEEFVALYDEMEHFMNMDPPCENPLPAWIVRQRFELKVQSAESSAVLFDLLAKKHMLLSYYEDGEIDAAQISLLRDMLVVKQQAKRGADLIRELFSDHQLFSKLEKDCRVVGLQSGAGA